MTEFTVEGSNWAEASKDGALCRIEFRNAEGETLVLTFPTESAGPLAHQIATVGQVSAGVAEKMGDTTAALVRKIEVFGSKDGSVIGLTLQSGEARVDYALTPDLSASFRSQLKAAEDDAKAKRKRRT